MHKVLIVDDEEINRLLLKTFLIKSNFEVEIAEDGLQAVEKLKKDKSINFVLTDIMMPNMNGIELLAYIRENEEIKNLPVIAVSAGNPEFWLTKTSHSFDRFFSKPVSREELVKYFLSLIA